MHDVAARVGICQSRDTLSSMQNPMKRAWVGVQELRESRPAPIVDRVVCGGAADKSYVRRCCGICRHQVLLLHIAEGSKCERALRLARAVRDALITLWSEIVLECD